MPQPETRFVPTACAVLASSFFAGSAAGNPSAWVTDDGSGNLSYATDAEGDRLPDFSTAGYRRGEVRIPDVATAITVAPGVGDDTAAIQAAINAVSLMPMDASGFRGAVQLERGEYQIATSLRLHRSGVVLRGAGMYGNGTVLRATGTEQDTLIEVGGTGGRSEVGGSRVDIVTPYLPVGSDQFDVEAGHGFSIGDRVVVHRSSPQAWLNDIGADLLDNPWSPGSRDLYFDRTVTAVNGNTITIDATIPSALEHQAYDNASIYKYTYNGRIENVGVENLRGVSDYDGTANDENHAWTFVELDRVENAWARELSAAHFGYAAVSAEGTAKNVTVQDVYSDQPISRLSGGRRYSFNVKGEQALVQRVFASEGRHDFVLASVSEGTNVFLYATSEDANSDSGPHHRWSVGTLFDNVYVDGDQINARYRGNSGTGHGWSGANMVIWNSVADGYFVQMPPTAQNWLIGSIGPVGSDTRYTSPAPPDGYIDSHGTRVAPGSLYVAQLADRLESPNHHATRTGTVLLGDIDGFQYNSSGIDDPPVDTDFAYGIDQVTGLGLIGFDQRGKDLNVAATFEFALDPHETVTDATLVLGLQVASGTYRNDTLWLETVASRLAFVETLGMPDDLVVGDAFTLVLDLSLIYGPLLEPLQDGTFSFNIYEDIAVDFAILNFVAAATRAIPGDTDGAGDIDDADLGTSFANYTGPVGAPGGKTAAEGDTDGDGDVDDADLGTSFAGYTGPLGPTNVPEPTSLALAVFAGLMTARRWRSA